MPTPPIPLKIFVGHVKICNYNMQYSSPMQHLRWSTLWQKLGNGWKLLLTVVLNVTGFLDLTLKCIDLDQGNKVFNLPLT